MRFVAITGRRVAALMRADTQPKAPRGTTPAIVGMRGLPAWATPDPTHPAVATLDPGLGVELVAWWGEWAHIRCSNGWEAWVNGRLLSPR